MTRVAAYCRVSTDRLEQQGSLAAQRAYFQDYIRRMPGWELCRVYADEGVTGTSVRGREAFLQMLSDAQAGDFTLLLTKEVSRFSRNILDTIAYTRQLRSLGVGVIFLNDGIDTREPESELRLAIMGSMAQEESRRTSQRVKWGQMRRMEAGVVFGRAPLGYTLCRGRLEAEPRGAATVRRIFTAYALEKKSAGHIAAALRAEGVPNRDGQPRWSASAVTRLLRNEKYVGELVQKKTVTTDYLTHARCKNRGQEPLVTLSGHHEPLIDRELWQLAQAELLRRARRTGERGASAAYCLSGRVFCGECGRAFTAKRRQRADASAYRVWACPGSPACGVARRLREEAAAAMLRQALGSLRLAGAPLAVGEGTPDETLLRVLVERITVYAEGVVTLRLRELPHCWVFQLPK